MICVPDRARGYANAGLVWLNLTQEKGSLKLTGVLAFTVGSQVR